MATCLALAFAIGALTVNAGDLLPALSPDAGVLADNDLVKVPGVRTQTVLLRFSNAINNTGAGELHIVAYRAAASPSTVDPDNNTMPAFQRITRDNGTFYDTPVGQLVYHPEHHHFHLDGAARYRLIDADTGIIVRESPKVSFCLADVAIVDATLPGYRQAPVYNACVHNPYATFAEMGISIGWADVYGKSLVGQSLDVTDLMTLPAKNYILESTTNPDGLLHESNGGPVSATVTVRIGVGVPLRVGKSRPGV